MKILSEDEIKELDSRIDSEIQSLKIFSIPKDVALIHVLRYFEQYAHIETTRRNLYDCNHAIKAGEDGIHFAIEWIYKYCPKEIKFNLDLDASVFDMAEKLFTASIQYSKIWDFMTLLHRKKAIAKIDNQNCIHLYSKGKLNRDMADSFIGQTDSPDDIKRAIDLAKCEIGQLKSHLEEIILSSRGEKRVRYNISDEKFDYFVEYFISSTDHIWELNPSWDIGGYSIAQFKEYYIVLLILSWVQHTICFMSRDNYHALQNVIKVWNPERLIKELIKRTKLSKDLIIKITKDLSYDETLYKQGGKKPDAIYQPIIPLANGFYVISNYLIIRSNAERNLWDLLSIKRPKIHSYLRNLKEKYWLEDLETFFKSLKLKPYSLIKFEHLGKQSDLDILVIDCQSLFGIGFQLKWLMGPDRIKDAYYVDQQLNTGIEQAILSLKWLNSNPSQLRGITLLEDSELAKIEFKVMVLSKNTIGSTWVKDDDFPVISERLLHWILGHPHHKDLKTLWHVGKNMLFMPKEGKHFRKRKNEASFGGINFISEDFSYEMLDPWNPEIDIQCQ